MRPSVFRWPFFHIAMTDFKDQDDLLRSKQVLEVFAIASEYCLFIDKIEQTTPDKALLFLQSILPALYLKGAMLPNVEVQDESANERFVTEEEYETLRYRLAQFFDTRDFFSTVDFSEGSIESVPTSLSELLADIYTDLKDFLILYAKESRSAKENAVAACHYYYHLGWGSRIATALPQIHHLVAADILAEEE